MHKPHMERHIRTQTPHGEIGDRYTYNQLRTYATCIFRSGGGRITEVERAARSDMKALKKSDPFFTSFWYQPATAASYIGIPPPNI